MVVGVLVVASIFAIPVSAAPGNANLSSMLVTETGETDLLGGGDHLFIRFGEDAAFGILWGTEENPNNIYIVTLMSRNLGYVDIYDNKGQMVTDDHGVKVYTMYAVKIDDIIEFDDQNGNGLLYYSRGYNESNGQYGNYNALETIFKRVDLATGWEASEVITTEDTAAKRWTFNLTATSLPYLAVEDGADLTGELDRLTFTFNLEVSTTHVDNVSAPQWRVTVNNGPLGGKWYSEPERLQSRFVSGNLTNYHVKWDKEIVGWDFDPENDHPMLLAQFGTIVGTYIPAGLSGAMEQLAYQHMVRAMNENGRMVADNETMNGTAGNINQAKVALQSPRLEFGGERSRIGAFEWVQNVTVDGEDMLSHSELLAVRPWSGFDNHGRHFVGFMALAGITFPGGSYIFQDPSVTSEALTEVTASTTDPGTSDGPGEGIFPMGLIGIGLVAVAAVAVGAMVFARRGRSGKVDYDQKDDQEKDDWSKYYDKK